MVNYVFHSGTIGTLINGLWSSDTFTLYNLSKFHWLRPLMFWKPATTPASNSLTYPWSITPLLDLVSSRHSHALASSRTGQIRFLVITDSSARVVGSENIKSGLWHAIRVSKCDYQRFYLILWVFVSSKNAYRTSLGPSIHPLFSPFFGCRPDFEFSVD